MTRQPARLEVVAEGSKWVVREHGIGRLTSHADKVAGVKAAREEAAAHPPCELTIRNADGSIEKQETY